MHFQWKERRDLFIFVDTLLCEQVWSNDFTAACFLPLNLFTAVSSWGCLTFLSQHKNPIKAGAAVERWVWICSSSSRCLDLTFTIIHAFVFTFRYRILHHTRALFPWAEWNNTVRTCSIQSSECNTSINSRNAVKIFCSQNWWKCGNRFPKSTESRTGSKLVLHWWKTGFKVCKYFAFCCIYCIFAVKRLKFLILLSHCFTAHCRNPVLTFLHIHSSLKKRFQQTSFRRLRLQQNALLKLLDLASRCHQIKDNQCWDPVYDWGPQVKCTQGQHQYLWSVCMMSVNVWFISVLVI